MSHKNDIREQEQAARIARAAEQAREWAEIAAEQERKWAEIAAERARMRAARDEDTKAELARRERIRVGDLLSRIDGRYSVIKRLYAGSITRVDPEVLGSVLADLEELRCSSNPGIAARRESGPYDAKVLEYGSGLRNFFDSKQPNVLSVDPAADPKAWLPYSDVGVSRELYDQSITITGDLAGLSAEAQRALLARVFSVYKEVSF